MGDEHCWRAGRADDDSFDLKTHDVDVMSAIHSQLATYICLCGMVWYGMVPYRSVLGC